MIIQKKEALDNFLNALRRKIDKEMDKLPEKDFEYKYYDEFEKILQIHREIK